MLLRARHFLDRPLLLRSSPRPRSPPIPRTRPSSADLVTNALYSTACQERTIIARVFLCMQHVCVCVSRLRIWSRETGAAVSRPASACSFSTPRLNLALTHGIPPDFRDDVHLCLPLYDIGPVPSLSGHHAIAYRWRSPPRVCRHRANSPHGSSSNGCCLCRSHHVCAYMCVFVYLIVPFDARHKIHACLSASRSSGRTASHAAFPGLHSSGTNVAVVGPHSNAFEREGSVDPRTITCLGTDEWSRAADRRRLASGCAHCTVYI